MHELIRNIKFTKHKYLVAKISAFAFAILFFTIIIAKTLLVNDEVRSMILVEFGAVSFFAIQGIAGLIVAIQQKLSQAITIRGKTAVINGMVWCTISFFLMLRYIYAFITDLFRLLR